VALQKEALRSRSISEAPVLLITDKFDLGASKKKAPLQGVGPFSLLTIRQVSRPDERLRATLDLDFKMVERGKLHANHRGALAGENEKACGAYNDFLVLWKDADPEIPTLKRAMEPALSDEPGAAAALRVCTSSLLRPRATGHDLFALCHKCLPALSLYDCNWYKSSRAL
jgi:hypothetical protein